MEKNALNFRKELKEHGVFYTPIEVCELMKTYVPFEPYEVYDPTVGQGNLLSVFADDVKKYGQELFEEELEKARTNLKNFEGYCGDTLADDGFKGRQFQCISSNPPYSVKWDAESLKDDVRFSKTALAPKSKADWAFLLHILEHLKDDGIAVVLVFPGILYRGNSEKKIRQWFIDNNYIERIVEVSGDKFVDTHIATDILVIRKNKTTTDVIFEACDGEMRRVSYEEIVENDYTLSINTYIQKETEKEEIDIITLNKSIIESDLRKIEAIIRLNVHTDEASEILGIDSCDNSKEFMKGLKLLIEKYDN